MDIRSDTACWERTQVDWIHLLIAEEKNALDLCCDLWASDVGSIAVGARRRSSHGSWMILSFGSIDSCIASGGSLWACVAT